MRTTILALLLAGVVGHTVPAASAEPPDPFVGTGGPPPWFSGGTTPAAAVPFGMLQLGPDTTDDAATGAPSANAAGYAATDRFVRGFSPTHISGAGCATFGDAPLLPVAGDVPDDPGAATAPLDKASEQAAPGRYSALVGGVAVDLAATSRAGLLRFAFPAGERAFVLAKADGSLAGTLGHRIRFPSDSEIAVRARSGGFCGRGNEYVVHVRYRFEQPFRSRGTWDGGAWVGFGRQRVVRAQVAISFVDAAGARRNLDVSAPGWSVHRLADRAAALWRTELGRVEVSGGDPEERRVFATALYHSLLHPTPVDDADGRYLGFDGRVRRLPDGEDQLSQIAGWDLWRTQLPLLAWLRPDIASQVVRSLLRDARQGGSFPRWPVVAEDSGVMNGDPAGPIAATAWAFGARDFPLRELVDRLVRQPRDGLADYVRLGFVPTTDQQRLGASTTLEYALADFAVARLAAAAGRAGVAQRLLARSGSWRSLLDGDLLRARDAEGAVVGGGFEEGNALQYTFGGVAQDMAGLLDAIGPAGEVAERLDAFFAHLNAGGEPHAFLGNQPSFLTPWTQHWLGDPAGTQDVVDRARTELWSAAPAGLPGNDDLGALSSWYVWTSLGLYPLTPGTANLAVGRPAFDAVTVRPLGGPTTRIVRTGSGAYVGALRVDGADRSASWIGTRPRRLEVVATDAPSAWGTAPADRPPSYGS